LILKEKTNKLPTEVSSQDPMTSSENPFTPPTHIITPKKLKHESSRIFLIEPRRLL